MKRKLSSAEELDAALIENQALEEIAGVARRYIPKLDADSPVRLELMRLVRRAPPEHPPAA